MGNFPPRLALAIVVLLAMPILFVGQNWGLPSRSADRFLIGTRSPWAGTKILQLSGGWVSNPTRGADVASEPLTGRDRPLILNQTDVQRAKILLRYRLYSDQPDEMITFRALAGMHPGHGPLGGMDPRLYQYGGLWIYPVGILLKLSPVTLHSDVAWYVDHPEDFGRFYVVARCYSAAWGLLGVAMVFLIVRRIVGGWAFPLAGGLLFALLPVVVDQSHEAKPHLAGAVLILFAALAGSIYVENGRRSAAISAGALCGAAAGMVLSCCPAFLILPMMSILRGRSACKIAGPLAAALAVYLVTNPYIAINLIANRGVLRSNLGNSAAMYHPAATGSALTNATLLIANGTGLLTALAGAIGAVLLARRAIQTRNNNTADELRRRATGLLVAVPSLWMVVQFLAFASGKPGEYGRFALYLDIVLAIEALVAIQTFAHSRLLQTALVTLLLVSTASLGLRYLAGFLRDCKQSNSRSIAAQTLADLNQRGKTVLLIADEPAPYCLPPVDLFSWKLQLIPRGQRLTPQFPDEVCVHPIEDSSLEADLFAPKISWADKRFAIMAAPAP
jgi:hypothetical protein